MKGTVAFVALAAMLIAPRAGAFYLPGVAPQQYENFEAVDMKVNKLTSIKTQLPYEYYALPFCQPTSARPLSIAPNPSADPPAVVAVCFCVTCIAERARGPRGGAPFPPPPL